MRLEKLINQYISYRKSLGEKFRTNENILRTFNNSAGPNKSIKSIDEKVVHDFLYGDQITVTSGWFVKHTALLGFYRYALTRNYVNVIPLPNILPKRPPAFVPYIYSQSELKLLFATALNYQTNKSHIHPKMVQAVLIIIYALGLRLHEALALKLGDVDLENSVIIIQQSKFYKSRLTPFNEQVKEFIHNYLQWRIQQKQPQALDAPVFVGKGNQHFTENTMRGIFKRVRKKSGIKRDDDANYQPRIHDLRHTFAVNRLTTWYQENKDVQQFLPILSTYLGHKHLAHTSVYLTMTNDLLNEANIRFEKYALG